MLLLKGSLAYRHDTFHPQSFNYKPVCVNSKDGSYQVMTFLSFELNTLRLWSLQHPLFVRSWYKHGLANLDQEMMSLPASALHQPWKMSSLLIKNSFLNY